VESVPDRNIVTVTNPERFPLAQAVARHESDQIQANGTVAAGDASTVVAHLAGKLKADLLVIGRKSAAGVLGRLDMTAYSIIRQSPCPVVSV
jgi:nucleotide-binding universal stress UspA family protein